MPQASTATGGRKKERKKEKEIARTASSGRREEGKKGKIFSLDQGLSRKCIT